MKQLSTICIIFLLLCSLANLARADTVQSGIVTAIRGNDITITTNTGTYPAIGSHVVVSYNRGVDKILVGVWQVSRVDGNRIRALPVNVIRPPQFGMNAMILPGTVQQDLAQTESQGGPASGNSTWINPDSQPDRPPVRKQKPRRRDRERDQAGIPAIQAMESNRYVRVWWDKGSGSRVDFTSFRPQAIEDYYPLGDIGVAGPWHGTRYAPPEYSTLLVKDGRLSLRRPIGYRLVWSSRGSGSNWPFSSWEPVPPPGYRCLGNVGNRSLDQQPSLDEIRCLPQQCVVSAPLREKIWDDTDSGAAMDFSVWKVPLVNVYVGNRSHSRPFQNVDTINPDCLK